MKQEIINQFLVRGLLLAPDAVESLDDSSASNLLTTLSHDMYNNVLCVTKELAETLQHDSLNEINWEEFDKARVLYDKNRTVSLYKQFLSVVSDVQPEEYESQPCAVTVLTNYNKPQRSAAVSNFVNYFNRRFETMERMLSQRQELSGVLPIKRIVGKTERETVSIIGIVLEKQYTKNGNLMLTVEDSTGVIKVLVNKNKPDMFEECKDIVTDEILGINGVCDKNIIFVNSVIWPDVPNTKELKKSPDEAYAVFLSDIHVGSNEFLEDEFLRFIAWLNGNVGNDTQKSIAGKVKYLFIAGDLIDGIGIYPGQEDDLLIKDVYQQYMKCAEYLKMVPKDVTIIISPGNHDSMRLSEPQPELYKDYAQALWEMENVIMVSNPAVVNVHASEDFPGFDVLIYHGYSFDYYCQEVESIRNGGGYDRADLIMNFLLKRRHLAPAYKSTLYIADPEEDPLVISKIPDIFLTGHIHKCSVSSYKNITTICGSCWQAKTAFQEKVGHHPEPCRVPLVNLQTREVKVMKFGE
ncbi:MAG: DNA-directed DNA polymerase II small subunit [Nanobdellota archaeon]